MCVHDLHREYTRARTGECCTTVAPWHARTYRTDSLATCWCNALNHSLSLSLSLSHTHTHTHTRICRLNCRYSTHKSCFNSVFILRLHSLPLHSILQNRDDYLLYIILCICYNNIGTDKSVTYLNGQQEGRHPRGRKELLHRDRRLGGHKRAQVSGGILAHPVTTPIYFALQLCRLLSWMGRASSVVYLPSEIQSFLHRLHLSDSLP